MTKITQDEFYDRQEYCFSTDSGRPLIDNIEDNYGLTAEQRDAEIEGYMRQFDDLDNLTLAKPPAPSWNEADLEGVEIIRIERHNTRYDRVYIECRELDNLLTGLDANSDEYGAGMSKLADAKRRLAIEGERSTDDVYRKFEEIDEWRATVGKEDYNASRRVSEQPNQMTPKDVLAVETPEQKKERLRQRNNELARQRHAKVKGKAE